MEQLSFQKALNSGTPVPRPVRRDQGKVIGAVALRRSEPSPERNRGNVTEIILPEGQVENFQLLLPMLTQLNRERRWLAWIDPPQGLVNKWQTMHGIVTGEILVLRSSETYSSLNLAERALGAGTCHAVVMWTQRLKRRELEQLQSASATGHSHGVVLRQR